MTPEAKKKIYQQLSQPFPEEAIERTDGRVTGKGYSTTGIKAQFVVNRLNEVLGIGGWRTRRTMSVRELLTNSGRKAYEAVCDLVMELGEWADGKFIPFAEALADGGHVSMSEADARKGAFSNGLKKAAAAFGAGWQAYAGTIDDDNVPAAGAVEVSAPSPRAPTPAVPASRTQAAPRQESSPRNRLTSKQLAAIQAIARKLGLDHGGLRAAAKQRYGVVAEHLSKAQASELITALSAQVNGNGHAMESESSASPEEG